VCPSHSGTIGTEEFEEATLRNARPLLMTITGDNTALIQAAEAKLREPAPAEERAKLFAQIGRWYRDRNRLEEARRSLEESLALAPGITMP
jgi:uncharacterized protein HemY